MPEPKVVGDKSGAGDPLTMEQVLVEVDKRITAGLTTALGKFEKEKFQPMLEQHMAPVSQQLTTIGETLAKLQGADPGTRKSQNTPEDNAQIKVLQDSQKKLQADLEQLRKEKNDSDKKAEVAERHAAIKTALASVSFANERAADTAFLLVEPHVRRAEDNTLIAGVNGESLPISAFVQDYLSKEHAYLLKPTGASGSGISPGDKVVRYTGGKVDLDSIRPGMKPEERAAAVAAIADAVGASQ